MNDRLLASIALELGRRFPGQLIDLDFNDDTETYTLVIAGHPYTASVGSDDDALLFYQDDQPGHEPIVIEFDSLDLEDDF